MSSSAETVRLATGPVSWGVDFADSPSNPPWPLVLDEIRQSGVRAMELGPTGYLPEDAAGLTAALRQRGLTAVGSFVFEDLHDPARRAEVLDVAVRTCRAIQAAEGKTLVIIDRVSHARSASFGRSGDARRLDQREWEAMVDCVSSISDMAVAHGLVPAFHPHAGSFVEFEDEIDRLVNDTSLALCLDTGHAALAGIDVAQALDKYRARLRHLHLKDIDGSVLRRALADEMTFWEALEANVFCPLGAGVVDFALVASQLDRIGYRGFATIEQDRVPGTGTPVADLRKSLEVLARAGFKDADAPLGG